MPIPVCWIIATCSLKDRKCECVSMASRRSIRSAARKLEKARICCVPVRVRFIRSTITLKTVLLAIPPVAMKKPSAGEFGPILLHISWMFGQVFSRSGGSMRAALFRDLTSSLPCITTRTNQRAHISINVPAIAAKGQPDNQEVEDEPSAIRDGEVVAHGTERRTPTDERWFVEKPDVMSQGVGHGNYQQGPQRSIQPRLGTAQIRQLIPASIPGGQFVDGFHAGHHARRRRRLEKQPRPMLAGVADSCPSLASTWRGAISLRRQRIFRLVGKLVHRDHVTYQSLPVTVVVVPCALPPQATARPIRRVARVARVARV